MNILALDCGTKTGWASLVGGTTESGVQDFSKRRGESNGLLFLRFNAWLKEIARNNSLHESEYNMFDVYVYELAHHRGGAATEIGVGLMTRVQEFATSVNAEYMAVHTATIKKFVTGSGRASKEDIIAWFTRGLGRVPLDDNEADAMALLEFARAELHV